MAKDRPRSPGLRALHDRYIGDDPERIASYERALADANIATDIYRLRTEAGLSQRELAERVGTTASVICRPSAAMIAASFVTPPTWTSSQCRRRDSASRTARGRSVEQESSQHRKNAPA